MSTFISLRVARSLSAAAILVSFAVLPACSSNDTNTTNNGTPQGDAGPGANNGTSGAVDFCALATIAELASITDVTMTKANPSSVGDDKLCAWEDAGGSSVLYVQSFATPRDFDNGKKLADSKPLAGVGEDAYLSGLGAIYVKAKGKTFMAQAQQPVKGKVVGPQVQAALANGAPSGGRDGTYYEASFQLAKVLVTKL